MSYLIVGVLCLLAGAVGGIFYGRAHPTAAAKIQAAATAAEQQAKKL